MSPYTRELNEVMRGLMGRLNNPFDLTTPNPLLSFPQPAGQRRDFFHIHYNKREMNFSLAGRIAQLRNLASRPQLNGEYVVIEGYNSQTDRHTVRILITPTRISILASFSVKAANRTFVSSNQFAQCVPRVSLMSLSGIPNVLKPGSKTEDSDAIQTVHAAGSILDRSSSSYLVRGTPVGFTNVDAVCPTSVSSTGAIEYYGDSPIEFEDIHFDQSVLCTSNQLTIFRRCRFTGPKISIQVNGYYPSEGVVFESCVFEDGDCAIMNQGTAPISMFNCIVRNYNTAGVISLKRQVTLIHSSICEMGNCGIFVASKSGATNLLNCSLRNCASSAVEIARTRGLHIDGCVVHNCGESMENPAIQITGPRRIAVHIKDTMVTETSWGISFRVGTVDATLERVDITKCMLVGLHIYPFVKGSVTLIACCLQDNQTDMMNLTSHGGLQVSVDGVQQPPQQSLDAQQANAVARCMDAIERSGNYRMLSERRAMKAIGGVASKCNHCLVAEQTHEKFRACGQCRQVVYCTRECQVAHWKAHKIECESTVLK